MKVFSFDIKSKRHLMDAGWRESYGEANEAHDGGGALLGVRVGVLGPHLAQD